MSLGCARRLNQERRYLEIIGGFQLRNTFGTWRSNIKQQHSQRIELNINHRY